MGRIPLAAKINFTRDVIAAGEAIDFGVVAATTKTREKYWQKWCTYAKSVKVDPLLQSTHPLIRDMVITAFAARVRTGYYGKGRQIRVQGVSDALSAISKTIELAGLKSPVYRSHNKYNLPIERCIEGWRRQDPPSVPQLALPVSVVNHLADKAYNPNEVMDYPKDQAIADLAQCAFYFLLRVGEYTRPRLAKVNGKVVRATRTVQFQVKDIGFFKNGKIVKRRSSLQDLRTADHVTFKITNQKNGRMGETISHEKLRTNQDHGPIVAAARRIHHILSNGGSETNLLWDFINEAGTWQSVTSTDMRSAVRLSVTDLGLQDHGIDPDLVGVHSLRAGGAMALKLQGVPDTTIKKQGRWTSMTFLQYIHTQIAHLTTDLSTKMSTKLHFQNIAAIEQ